ncbi:MAG: alpha/beta fold hydrolase [Spirochaetaceae bacterium]|nr:MAG: alpha/beta fold hydrolase [Spirochaetaceae bacterium]
MRILMLVRQNELADLPDLSSVCAPGATYQVVRLAARRDVSLRCITFRPPRETARRGTMPEIVFIGGLASIIENFTDTLRGLTRTSVVHYLETHEKGGSRIAEGADLSIPAMARDVAAAVAALDLRDGSYIMTGYSLGATLILEAVMYLRQQPAAVVLVEPNAAFPFPGWVLLLARFGSLIYRPMVPFLKWYVRCFRINVKQDEEMYRILCRILDAADPLKICAVVRAIAPFRLDGDLARITIPSLVIGTSLDSFHNFHDSRVIADGIHGSVYLDLQDNRRSHSAEVARHVERFVISIRALNA